MITMNRIMIVDDHAAYRDALRAFLSQEPDFEIVGEAGNLREAITSIDACSPHLVLTDLTMPDTHGVEAVSEIKRSHPEVKILVVSFHRENEYRRVCQSAGASGYIVKDAIYNELRDGIRTVLGGKTYMGAEAGDNARPDFLLDTVATKQEPHTFLH